jgi:hypothetical protein
MISGEPALRKYAHGAGFRGFCGECGTRLFNGLESGDGFISLIVATLDDEPAQGPVMHVNLESKAAWYEIEDDLPQYDVLPEDVVSALNKMGSG